MITREETGKGGEISRRVFFRAAGTLAIAAGAGVAVGAKYFPRIEEKGEKGREEQARPKVLLIYAGQDIIEGKGTAKGTYGRLVERTFVEVANHTSVNNPIVTVFLTPKEVFEAQERAFKLYASLVQRYGADRHPAFLVQRDRLGAEGLREVVSDFKEIGRRLKERGIKKEVGFVLLLPEEFVQGKGGQEINWLMKKGDDWSQYHSSTNDFEIALRKTGFDVSACGLGFEREKERLESALNDTTKCVREFAQRGFSSLAKGVGDCGRNVGEGGIEGR
ncbi:MAG: hypothetical protein V1746_08085 [bacterium]